MSIAVSPAAFSRFSLIGRIQNFIARRGAYRQTLMELGALSDRELRDIGLSRPMIREIAREASGLS